jgi:hypothetical protein
MAYTTCHNCNCVISPNAEAIYVDLNLPDLVNNRLLVYCAACVDYDKILVAMGTWYSTFRQVMPAAAFIKQTVLTNVCDDT